MALKKWRKPNPPPCNGIFRFVIPLLGTLILPKDIKMRREKTPMPFLVHSGASCWSTIFYSIYYSSFYSSAGMPWGQWVSAVLALSDLECLNAATVIAVPALAVMGVRKHQICLAASITCNIVSLQYVTPCLSVPLRAFIILLTDHITLYPLPVLLSSKWKMKCKKPK